MTSVLRAYFFKRAPSGDVDDLVQDVLLNLHRRQARSLVTDVESYIFRVAANVWRDQLRRDKVRQRSYHCELTEDRHGVDDLSPERRLVGRSELEALILALQDLPERTRQAFILLRFEQMSYADVAKRMKISISAVEQHAARALALLSKRLQDVE